jgi:undecaprenyl-diphosphatase
MDHNENSSPGNETPKLYPVTGRLLAACLLGGGVLLITGLVLWNLRIVDEAVLFFYNPARQAGAVGIALAQWFSDFGRLMIVAIFVVYPLASSCWRALRAPYSIHLYTLTSWALSGLATTILKVIFSRPRPLATFGEEIRVLTEYITFAMPSGHATTSIALALPFMLLAPGRSRIDQGIKIVVTLIALGVAFSRIVLGVHYVGDVIAGVGVALIGLPFSMALANWILQRVR